MLSKSTFVQLFSQEIPHQLTNGQREAIARITEFLYRRDPTQLFVLKGYAGTGKTTLVSALVRTFHRLQKKTVLLAPTGRAAKVFAAYSGSKAFTLHKHLYNLVQNEEGTHISRKRNKNHHTLFIVDEVSMIPIGTNGENWGDRDLLADLIDYVFEGEGNKLLFIGDDAQLPPVFSEESPALELDYLRSSFSLNAESYQLTEVVRQTHDSGILFNATALRTKIEQNDYSLPLFWETDFSDFHRLSSIDLEDKINELYSYQEPEETVIITRSNKRANIFNQEIRNRVFFRDNEIASGDFLMIVKNNYNWVEKNSSIGFLANGELIEVLAVRKREELYGFHFADVSVRFCDYPDYPEMEIKILLETLSSEGAALPKDQQRQLYMEVAKDYEDIADKRIRALKMRGNPYLNAVQVKFAYALTCHKTQGGQWANTYIDLNYFSEDQLNKETFRWLYTALTRTTEQVYLINFPDEFFEK